jgi:hypothetical protein
MPRDVTRFPDEVANRVLTDHIDIGPKKPVSYLPINTVENVIDIPVSEYKLMIEGSGNQCSIFDTDQCCIKSGAVYAYSREGLDVLLKTHQDALRKYNWPTDPDDFIRRIASEWLEDESPIMPIVRRAFGE